MATIKNLHLAIDPSDDRRNMRVSVQYQVCFTNCEALAGTVFTERVVLTGDDWFDNDLTTVRNTCVRAERGCVDRNILAVVPRATLDEDDSFFDERDEVYARVSLKPLVPAAAELNSNIVKGFFGSDDR